MQYRKCVVEYHKDKPTWSKILPLILIGDSVLSIAEGTIYRVHRMKDTVFTDNLDLYEFQYLFSKRHGKTVEECLKGLNLNSYPKPAIKIPIDE